MTRYFSFIFFAVFLVLFSCSEDFQPKPKGYFRIDPLERKLINFHNEQIPFTFEYPNYFEVIDKKGGKFDLYSPYYNASFHFTYKPLVGNFDQQLSESIRLTLAHIKKAEGLDDKLIEDIENQKYAITYTIYGEVASPYQFVATDSVSTIVRGSFYYNTVPNVDSLAPVFDQLKVDMDHIIESLTWTKN
jgi:gliding motility-associated lipoprotein GldD